MIIFILDIFMFRLPLLYLFGVTSLSLFLPLIPFIHLSRCLFLSLLSTKVFRGTADTVKSPAGSDVKEIQLKVFHQLMEEWSPLPLPRGTLLGLQLRLHSLPPLPLLALRLIVCISRWRVVAFVVLQ